MAHNLAGVANVNVQTLYIYMYAYIINAWHTDVELARSRQVL